MSSSDICRVALIGQRWRWSIVLYMIDWRRLHRDLRSNPFTHDTDDKLM